MGRRPDNGKDPALIKKEVLERLAQGYGILETCKLLRIGRSTYYKWKGDDEAFSCDVERVLADPLHGTRILSQATKAEVGIEEDWKLRFLGVYRKTGDRNQALANVGEGKFAHEIEAALDPHSTNFDEAFSELFKNEEQKRLWQIEDNTLKKAIHDMPTARFVLSNLVKEKYGKLEGTTTIQQVWFSQVGEEKALSELSSLFDQTGTKQIEAIIESPS